MSDHADDDDGKERMAVLIEIDAAALTIDPKAAMQTAQGVAHMRADVMRALTDPKAKNRLVVMMSVPSAIAMLTLFDKFNEQVLGEEALRPPADYEVPSSGA